jgi:arylsulfatase A-like enzyme
MALLLGLAAPLACTRSDSDSPKDRDTVLVDSGQSPLAAANIVLIMADTLRAASTSLVSIERDITPKLAAWAAEQVVFENAIAPAGWTPPSMASVFSGLYMSAHGLRDYQAVQRVDQDIFL